MIVIDTSVFTDFLVKFDEDRHSKARSLFNRISEEDLVIYEPFLFEIELAGVLRRRYGEKVVLEILNSLRDKVEFLDEVSIHKTALDVAIKTLCRAVDAYFIATAKITSSALVTNDRIMANNARKSEVGVYYLIEEFEELMKKLKS